MAQEKIKVRTTSLNHLALLEDGNRRWARAHGVTVEEGHRVGFKNVKDIAIAAAKMGIPYITSFMFSTENWSRNKDEVEHLMRLFIHFAEKYSDEFLENGIKLVHVGSREGLPPAVLRALDAAAAKTAGCKKATVVLCINYGGQQEIVDATKKLLRERVDPVRLTVKDIEKSLYHPEIPDVDLVVRTSGEYRLSNFMLWRAAYAELMFVDKLWPDFGVADLQMVIKQYESRERRRGA